MVCPGTSLPLWECANDLELLRAAGAKVSAEITGNLKGKHREVVHLPSLPSKGLPYTHDNTVSNVVRSLRDRVFGKLDGEGHYARTVQPQEGAFQAPSLRSFRRRVLAQLPRHSLPISQEQFCGSYRGQKRQRYESAVRSLKTKGLVRADSYPGVFLKSEKWFEEKAGRVISARSPRYNVSLGVYIQSIEHDVYRAVDLVFGGPTIMKGYTPERRAAVIKGHWLGMKRPVAVGQDFSKFDQHISREALAYEHGFYMGIYDCPELARLLAWQLGGKCYARTVDGVVKYEVVGGRMSGDMNTALGNCIISAALLWAYCRELGIKVKAVIDGDDSVSFIEEEDLQRYQAGIAPWMLEKGFILVSEQPVRRICDVEFCQSRYTNLDVPTMVRNPIKAITQDHIWVVDKQLKHADVLAATGIGGLSLYGSCPVLGAYYHSLSRASPNGTKTLLRLETRGSWLRAASYEGRFVEPSEAARYAFWETWGIEPGEQRALEDFFANLNLADLANCERSYDQNVTTQVYFPCLLEFLH